MTETPLDRAYAAMSSAPEDDALRLRFHDRLADAELFLMLTREAEGDVIDPEIFDLGDARFVLAFDREDRLAAFANRPVPYLGLSGRTLVGMLAGQGIGLGLNLEVAPSSTLLPPEAMDWLAQTLAHAPAEAEARVETLGPPRNLPEALFQALDSKLAGATGLARKAYLAEVGYEGGARGHLLGFTGALPGAERALAQAVNEALVFSGLDAGALDVTFLPDKASATAELARVALRFDLPQPETPEIAAPVAPGSQPDKPPRLK